MHSDPDTLSTLLPFLDEGWISEVLYEVKSGKEATVFCCSGGPRSPVPLIAAKVYRPLETRLFRNDSRYLGGRLHMARAGRAKRAAEGGTTFGKKVQFGTWLFQEWETLSVLYDSGVAVPRPLCSGERAILLTFLGDETGPAPMMHEITPDPATAAAIIDEVLRNIEMMLHCDCVHGDLSPFNIMIHEDRPLIIDFPQSIDPRLNRHGYALLARDIQNICGWAEKHGTPRPAGEITMRLWERFMLGEIG